MYVRAAGLVVSALLFAGSAAVAAEVKSERPRIYRWVDDNGIAHYTTDPERIPAALRSRMHEPVPLSSSAIEAHAPASALGAWEATDRPAAAGAAATEDPNSESLGPLDDFSDDENPQARARRSQIDARIAELEAVIAKDEEALKARISSPSSGGPLAAGDDPEFLSIAGRLPKQLAELRQLREERATLESGS